MLGPFVNNTLMTALGCYLLLGLNACTTVREGGYQIDNDRAATLNTQLGAKYLDRGSLDLAKKKLEKALEQNPDLPEAHAIYALLQSVLGHDKSAEKHYKKALRFEPNNPQFLNNYGRYLCSKNRLADAEEKFMAALKDPLYKTPEYPFTNAGECAYKSKDYDRAEGYFRKALQHNPRYGNALYNMARLSEVRRQYRLADAYLKRYHDVGKRTAESLYFAIELAKKLNNNDDRASYTLLLKNTFPDSEEAKKLRTDKR